jgi:1-acyl-sn-glycerol-3-phosphate acyltransferase
MLDRVLYWTGVPVVGGLARTLFNFDVVYRAPLPAGPKILAPNHPSTTDPFLVLLLACERVSILIDDRLFHVPVFGRYLRGAGHVPVVPGHGRAAFDTAWGLLTAGRSVAIYPEGAISPLAGGLHPPRTGVARLALLSGAPVIPIGVALDRARIRLIGTPIAGETAVGTWCLGGPYAVTVGEPLWFRGDPHDRELVQRISAHVMQRIRQLAAQSGKRLGAPAALRQPAFMNG